MGDVTARSERLTCPFCGFDVTDFLLCHPHGLAGAVAVVIANDGMPCCNDVPTADEVKAWARIAYA